MMAEFESVSVIDSHTGGEPTRVIVAGGPDLGTGPLAHRCDLFRARHDRFRSAVLLEPRGSDVLVGALLLPAFSPESLAGVIFFNNVGVLGMCGHGTIGVVETLAFLGKIMAGSYHLDTPVGVVSFQYEANRSVVLENVPSYRVRAGICVDVPGYGTVQGDVAWGGNWFFLVKETRIPVEFGRVDELTRFTSCIRQSLRSAGVTGAHGQEIDHIELFGPPVDPQNQSRNFVLCPGSAYDRSPCGTGTSAKLACLAEDGTLMEGEIWRQESIVGSVFEGWYRHNGCQVIPTIRGRAFITGKSTLLFDPEDPFREGIRP